MLVQLVGPTSAAGGGGDVGTTVTQEGDPREGQMLFSLAEIADMVFMPCGGGSDVTAWTHELTLAALCRLFFRSVQCGPGFLSVFVHNKGAQTVFEHGLGNTAHVFARC